MGVCNMLCLTGDDVGAGDHPQAKPVFDLDCMSLLAIGRMLRDEQRFQSGRRITTPPRVFFGAAANPFGQPLAWRAERIAKKAAAGAEFVQTQYCYDVPVLREFMRRLDDLGVLDKLFVLVGVGPLKSAKAAEWIRKKVPGVHIPDAVIQRLAGAQDQAGEGRQLCVDIINEVREIKGVSGVHVMAYRQEEAVAEIIQRSGVLAGRTPWYPGRDRQSPATGPAA
jgi:methylenetetrahydrofolate reductase (NADPH)